MDLQRTRGCVVAVMLALAVVGAGPAWAQPANCSIDLLDAGAGDWLGWVKAKLTAARFQAAHEGQTAKPHPRTEIFVKPHCDAYGRGLARAFDLPEGAVRPLTWKSSHGVTLAADRSLAQRLANPMAAGRKALTLLAGGSFEAALAVIDSTPDIDVNVGSVLSPGVTPLEAAIRSHRPELVAALLRHGAWPNDVSGNDVESPLSLAVVEKDAAAVRLLLDAGASPDSLSDSGHSRRARLSALFSATCTSPEIFTLLLARGAQASSGDTPAICEAARKCPEYLPQLLEKKADVNARCGAWTPVKLAALRGDAPTSKLLLEKGARVDASELLCASLVSEELVTLALSRGGKVDGCRGRVASFGARTLRLFLDRGLDPGTDGLTRKEGGPWPLICSAAEKGDAESLDLLLGRGVKASAACGTGTPLHQAQSLEAARALVARGADLTAFDGRGMTPLHAAVWAGRKDVAELLLTRGAKVNEKTRAENSAPPPEFTDQEIVVPAGSTALDIARLRSLERGLIDLLEAHGGS